MKKLFIVLAISSLGFVACNNAAEGDQSADSSAVAPTEVDTTTPPPAVSTDTVVNLDTNNAAPGAVPPADTTKK